MLAERPRILLAFNQQVRDRYIAPADVARLETIADWDWFPCEGGGLYDANTNPAVAQALHQCIGRYDGLVVCHGSPAINDELLDAGLKLKIIGELEGDRFASRIDLDAAWARRIRTVDVTNGSSYPVSEWALGLILLSMRNAGAFFRRILAGQTGADAAARRTIPGSLAGRRVGLIGCGHMGRHLVRLLRPFDVEIWAYDPYLPPEMAEALGFLRTSLDNVLSRCDVIVCLAPLTPTTRGMIGEREIDLMQSGTIFVNVSRGAVVDSDALIARLKRGDIIAGLDVFDPEPIPPESEIIQLPNVFLSPHIGAHAGGEYRPFFALMVDELERFFAGHETYFDLTPRSKANRSGQMGEGLHG